MHPILSNRGALQGYAAGWLVLGAILAVMLRVSANLPFDEVVLLAVPLTLFMAVISLSAWFVCRSQELTTTSDWKIVFSIVLAGVCASTLVLAFTHALVLAIEHFRPGFEARFQPAQPAVTALALVYYIQAVTVHYLAIATSSSQKANALSREAELKALKAQVNTHFLFNSLNSISALTSVDPRRAREMCIALSDFLRSSLRLGERTTIPLAEELALTRSYLEVERVRFGQKLRVKQEMESGCAECDVPPLLVQPLVENAIKHGIATLTEGGEIAVTGVRRQDKLRVTVENPFDPDAPPASKNGFGLMSVRNRIQARYGHAGKLEIEVGRAFYRVSLSLPWHCASNGPEERAAGK